MNLPQTTEYALRALAHIATQPEGTLVRAESVAEETSVPLHYLHKVLRRLAAGGILEAKKGPGGGFSLARDAAKITFEDVFEALDSPLPETCAFGWGKCDAKNPCPLHGAYSQWKEAMERWSTQTTLADVRDYALKRRGKNRSPDPKKLPVMR